MSMGDDTLDPNNYIDQQAAARARKAEWRERKNPGDVATREQVYDAIDSERAYQAARWGGFRSAGKHEDVGLWLVYMRDYIEEALHIVSREPDEQAVPKALDIVRKVTTLGVSCMEQLGAPRRSGF